MANDLNQCNFIGRLGKDVEIRYLPNGNAVANFSIAVNKSWKKDGVKQEKTSWIKLVAFGKLAEICGQYVKKGQQIFVSGELTENEWEKEGVKRYTTEIVVKEMNMLGGGVATSSGRSPVKNDPAPPYEPGFDDDLPDF